MTDTFFLTGATGFLGTEIASSLIQFPQVKVYALVRAASDEEAAHRLRAMWQHDSELKAAVGSRIVPVRGDFTRPLLGMSEENAQRVREEAAVIVHAGAEIGFQKSKEELWHTNIDGTQQMLFFAARCPKLRRFVYISTAYVAGQRKGTILESDSAASSFSTYYEESKATAERLVKNSGLPFSICRPGMIVGDSKTGWVRNFNTIYYVLKQMLLGRMRVLPISRGTRINIVPGDWVARAVVKICQAEEAMDRTFHLTCPPQLAPTAEELAQYVRTWARENLAVSVPSPVFAPLPALRRAGLSYNRRESDRKKGTVTNMLTLLPYFYELQEFDRTDAERICGALDISWKDYMDRLLSFACRKNFMRQTGQTVFEQARVRRESTRYPIAYYDVAESGVTKVSGPEVNERIDRALSALWAWGIRKGDRVALAGINSVDYLVLEQAIGLMGAVSVPIYYTTPAAEASLLLERSGAEWFFVGDRRMLAQVPQMTGNARIVTFSAVQGERVENGMTWQAFLARAGEKPEIVAPEPEDLATIRYTSGTTGEPKGVMFNFSQLAWMGEVMTNLVGWRDRSRPMRYLSFLPLSHVVEGILASYAPYYMLTDVGYYFLNDFGKLTEALPKVRPTIFFSVPRFYEKLWAQAMGNRLGQIWQEKKGLLKKAAGLVLKKAVLRRAGMDRCGQLIVGSAPVSETLLLAFRSLGIEVYNAYGQTEAPLITINRAGDNVIPSIGTPLPETTVTCLEDGELVVRGPQVCLGYYGLETENIREGTLYTGDLGQIDERGHVTLHGRKKDFIITSYGKNISIPKLEERLKDIPGVSEAVLIGENRPYCTALLWLGGEDREAIRKSLDAQIEEMNAQLSHPEQIRRFTVVDRALSIGEGELTPNLKVKRRNVEAHFREEIEEMYR